MATRVISSIISFTLLAACFACPTLAVEPAAKLLPSTTVGFLSVADVDALVDSFHETQLGQLVNDPVIQPFVDDIKKQIKSKLSPSRLRLGLGWDELQEIAAGETCVANIQPQHDPQRHATAILVDVSGNLEAANAAVKKASDNLLEQGAKKRDFEIDGVNVTEFSLPPKQGQTNLRKAYYCLHQDQLIAVDDLEELTAILGRFGESPRDSLENVEAFVETQKRCAQEQESITPQIHWFIEPFGYVKFNRATNNGRKKRGTDMLKVLANQGFTAVRGLGGFVNFATDAHEIMHRTFIYAPPVTRPEGDDNPDKYDLAARMLDFPPTDQLVAKDWVPRSLANHITFNWKIQNAFWYAETLVDEIAGDPVFRDVIDSIKDDPQGPMIDLENELINLLGERGTILVDNILPTTPESERLLLAIEITETARVRNTIDKAMESDPDAQKEEYHGHTIWQILKAPDEEVEVAELQIDGLDDDLFGDEEEEEEEEAAALPNFALTVTTGHLIVSTHADFITDILQEAVVGERLKDAADYNLVLEALKELGSQEDSLRVFARTDESYRPTYELIKNGQMPESKSLLGKMLNSMLGPEEEGVLRNQEIDGALMPEFDLVRRYLGPTGIYLRQEEAGWFMAGCLLTKQAELSTDASFREIPAEASAAADDAISATSLQ